MRIIVVSEPLRSSSLYHRSVIPKRFRRRRSGVRYRSLLRRRLIFQGQNCLVFIPTRQQTIEFDSNVIMMPKHRVNPGKVGCIRRVAGGPAAGDDHAGRVRKWIVDG